MRPKELPEALAVAAKLKTNTRHCRTAADRKESVANHSWRLALMALLLENEPEFRDADMSRVTRMCLIHDLGEAFTGDIPAFLKQDADTRKEEGIVLEWAASFPEADRAEWLALLGEMNAMQTREAGIYKALDKLEALISHNESDLGTWLPLEYDLQKTYGQENMDASPYFKELREPVDRWTDEKTGKKP